MSEYDEPSIDIMDDIARLAAAVYDLDERASIGYAVKKVLEATARNGVLDDSLRTVRDVLILGSEVPDYRKYMRQRRVDIERERIEQGDIHECGLSERTVNILCRNGIHSLSDAMELGPDGLSQFRNIGEKSVEEIMTASSRMAAERVADA